jgi:glutathione S-transferase
MEYLSIAEAKVRRGLRLVLSMGVPGPWGEAAKAILHVKGIPYTPVGQIPAAPPDPLLVEWTGCANAPWAMYEDEPPRSGWAEILLLAERLRAEPRLIPDDAEERATMLGFCHEICGEQGFGWSRRLMMIDALMSPQVPEPMRRAGELLASRYGYSAEAAARAPGRVAELLRMFSRRLERQRDAGSAFLFGRALSAADLYWAAFAGMVAPLAPDACPLPESLRAWYTNVGPVVADALAPELLAHRDRIYASYLPLPMTF